MRIWIFVLSLCLPSTLFAQSGAATSEWNGEAIDIADARVIQTAMDVQGLYVDNLNGLLYATLGEEKQGKLKNRGALLQVDLHTAEKRWQIEMKHSEQHFILHDTIPLMGGSGKKKSNRLDRNSGATLWTSRDGKIFYCQPGANIGIGVSGPGSYNLSGFDLATGEAIWSTKVPTKEVVQTKFMGDSAFVMFAGHIYYVNALTGESTMYQVRRSSTGPGAGAYAAAGILGGLMGVLLLAAITDDFGPTELVGGDLTNTAIFGDYIFTSTNRTIYAFSMGKDVGWREDFLDDIFTLPKLMIHDDMLYLIASSFGADAVYPGQIGDQFVEIRNPITGEVIARNSLQGLELGEVIDFVVRNESIVFAMRQGVIELRLDDLSTVKEQTFSSKTSAAGLQSIVRPPYFILEGDKVDNRSESAPEEFYMQNAAGMKIRFDTDYNMQGVVRKTSFFKLSQDIGDFRIINNDKRSLLINHDNEIMSDIAFTENLRSEGDKLIDYDGDRILILPLSALRD